MFKLMLRILSFVFLGLLALLWQTTAMAEEKPATSLDKVVLQLKWLHQFQFAGYYAAQKEGYFAERGLDVEIRERDLEKNNIQQVLNGEAQYGIADSILMLYQAKGNPLVIVAPIFQHSPQTLITLKSSGIDSPYQLEGKSVAFYQKDTDGFAVLAMANHLGIELNLQRLHHKTDPGVLVRGEVDVYAGYLTNEPYYLYQQGIEVNLIKPMNYGIDLYGDMLFTSRKELQEHPERVAAMRKAVIKGWQYALQNKREIAQYILDTYQPKNKTLDHLIFEAKAIEEMMAVNSTPIGTMDRGRLEFTKKLFHKHNLVQNDWDLSEGIYQPQISKLSFTAQEEAWIEAHPVLKLGIDPEWFPIDFVDENGQFSGISSELFHYIEEKTGLKFEVSPEYSWAQTIDMIKHKRLDLLSALTITEERKTYLKFTRPYLNFPTVVATRTGTPYLSNLKTLDTMKLAVVRGYAAQEFIELNFPAAQLFLVDSPLEGLKAVSKGDADGYVDNVAVIGHYIRTSGLGNLQVGGELPFSKAISIGVRDDWPELQGILDKVLAQLNPKELSEMQNRYLMVQYQSSFDWKTLLSLLVPLLIILAVIAFYTLQLRKARQDLQEKNQILHKLSSTDYLTGVYNRSYIDKRLLSEIARAKRYQTPLSILLFDLDHFKSINDTYGHDMGDEVLQTFTEVITSSIREIDVFGRWGGEEFLLISPNTDIEQAYFLAERIRHEVNNVHFRQKIRLASSIGVAELRADENLSEIVKRADEAVYSAKEQGRDQTVIAK
ncbi:diguanylate cyclase [Thiomicrorhabdus xiamenensis]|uniref:diguanylate cyclase n=1 Tax=Thiomicrorhabdus xiamenensis TaxID=2739063 RepID=A0A7D4SYS6_9GAMM|nr:diguanylate cyclase [Thiomicrorhabdus xiamenensis]QKI89324.1 diguanylate cyclase [Thiomicrorhabdus xiamenensis]